MNKLFGTAVTMMLCAALFGCGTSVQPSEGAGRTPPATEQGQATDLKAEEDAVVRLVEDFGGKLQMVSLLAPEDVLNASMREHYGEYVTPDLLARWLAAPEQAPGRTVSSPWPDRIEVNSLERLPDGSYRVHGEFVEVAITGHAGIEPVAKYLITLEVKPDGNRWLISKYSGVEAGQSQTGISYINTQYGFLFSLPDSWTGYTVVEDNWEGRAAGASQDEAPAATGPMLLIRHPAWTADKPRQDIPILIFTLAQ